jgi:hypothetical protein
VLSGLSRPAFGVTVRPAFGEDEVRDPDDRQQPVLGVGHLHLVADEGAPVVQNLGPTVNPTLARRSQVCGVEVDSHHIVAVRQQERVHRAQRLGHDDVSAAVEQPGGLPVARHRHPSLDPVVAHAEELDSAPLDQCAGRSPLVVVHELRVLLPAETGFHPRQILSSHLCFPSC